MHSYRCHGKASTSSRAVARCIKGETTTRRSRALEKPPIDCIALSNLCVDVVVPMKLPSKDLTIRASLLSSLTANPPGTHAWEIGGNGNFLIAASRIGLSVKPVGHVGQDAYGRFMATELKQEGVADNEAIAPIQSGDHSSKLDQTLVCFVLVDPDHSHAFCSRYDFGPWPLLQGIPSLPEAAKESLKQTRAVFTNGFIFDELPLHVVTDAISEAIEAGASVFFDPGPRCFTMLKGERREALDTLMDLSDVVLMTEEESQTVTGEDDLELAARIVLNRPGSRTEWCVIKLGGKGAMIRSKSRGSSYFAPGIKVDVQDTVGCGDSFASAIVLGFIRGYGIYSTLALANAVGAATAMGRGAGRNVANATLVRSLLERTLKETEEASWVADAFKAGDGNEGKRRCAHIKEALEMLGKSLDAKNNCLQ